MGGVASHADAHDALMRPDARHGRLVDEPWVMRHWSPIDERQAEQELGLGDGQLEAFLYNDHRTLAQLARSRGVAFEPLVQHLSAWSSTTPGADPLEIQQRVRIMLVSGHLAQHVLYHVFHGANLRPPILDAAGLTPETVKPLRASRRSYAAIVRRAGGNPDATEQALSTQLGESQQQGIDTGQTPPGEATQMLDAQRSQLHCWYSRPMQQLDASAPYGRSYLLHRRGHTSADVPKGRAAQAVEDRAIEQGRAGRPPSCWRVPAPFSGDPGAPLTRHQLRGLARLPHGFVGPVNGPGTMNPGMD